MAEVVKELVQKQTDHLSSSKTAYNILVAVTGSVATIKLAELVILLKDKLSSLSIPNCGGRKLDINIRIVMTENSKHFMPKRKLINAIADSSIQILDDSDEWNAWKKIPDPVLHIDLTKWADIMLIAPLDANTMAKLSNGICDNLLTCIVRAWDTTKQLIYCPAMNVHMYNHPLTKEQLCKLQSFGYIRVDAIEKKLACGDFGMGAMANLDTIVDKVSQCILNPNKQKLSMPLLKQQPTYPIVSLSTCRDIQNAPSTSSSKNTFASNFKFNLEGMNLSKSSNCSTSIRYEQNKVVPNITIKSNLQNAANSIKNIGISTNITKDMRQQHRNLNNHTQTQSSQNNNSTSSSNTSKSCSNNNNSNKYTLQASNNRVKNRGFNECTSLQNLTAATGDKELQFLNNHISNYYDNLPNGSYFSEGDDEIDECEDEQDDFDPTKMLEQSMIVDDDDDDEIDQFAIDRDSFNQSNNDQSSKYNYNESINNINDISQAKRLVKDIRVSRQMNTSKFLDLCYDFERKIYKCSICLNDYQSRKSLARHLKEQHVQGNIYDCEPCGVSYKRKEQLMRHMNKHHNNELNS